MTKALNAFDIIQMTYYFHFRFSQQEGVNVNPKRKKKVIIIWISVDCTEGTTGHAFHFFPHLGFPV